MLCPKCHRPLADESDGPYICCAGASMQWQCRQCAKVSEGFALPYGRCPHCNGELALREGGAASSDDARSIHAVRMAFEIELGGRAFYQRAAAASADDAALRALFERFAVMEGEHMETLARRYHLDIPDPSPDFRIEVAAIFADVPHAPRGGVDTGEDLFRIAIALEHRAAAFFTEHAARAPQGAPEQLLFQELAAEECEHAELLTTEQARWRERRPGLFGHEQPATGQVPINAAELVLAGKPADRIAIECGGQRITYGELTDRVARAAGLWRQRGLHSGDRVAVKLPDGIDWVVAFLGAIWAGGVAVAVNPHIPASEWQFILEQAGFNVILAESDADTPEPWRSRVVLVDEGRRAVAAAQPIAPMRLDPETPAFWCHSSGTSGRPKAVVHAHRFAREVQRVSVERLGLVPDDRLFASSRLFFSYPQTNIFFAGLKLGATLLLDPQWPTAASVVATVQQMKATVLFSVPSLYRVLLADGHAPQLAAAGVRRCISAGEALPAALRQGWADASGIQIIDGYGASEVLVLVLTSVAGDDGLKPSPGVTVRPVDPEAAREGLPSRLCIEVSTLALGYLDQPAAQADSFRNGTFCPADLFVATPGGGWRFAGREDALVKIKGRWVNLVELEQRLSQDVPGLAEAACACVPDADGLDIVAVFYAPQPGRGDEVARALRDRCETLPSYQRPKLFQAIDTLPRTATGKLVRRRLVDMARPGH